MTKEIIENDPYKLAGVDIDQGNKLIEQIKNDVASTHNVNVLGNIGGFAGMYKLGKEFKNPILVACTDGVGTKVALAQQYQNLKGIGQDLVAMCVNDLIVCGAKPLFFLDYYASSKLNVDEASDVIKGIARACIDSGCSLLGGETAEMPGHYIDNNFDLAGFSVGCVEEEEIIKNKHVNKNDVLIGIGSSGPHSNGYSLIRKIIDETKIDKSELKEIIDLVLKPTLLYPKLVLSLISEFNIKSISHITGGGLSENLPRSIPSGLCAEININSWDLPFIFKWLQENGEINDDDMFRVFNCGIGMVLVVKENQANEISKKITSMNFENFIIGKITEKQNNKSVIYK